MDIFESEHGTDKQLMWGVLTCCLSLSKNAETVCPRSPAPSKSHLLSSYRTAALRPATSPVRRMFELMPGLRSSVLDRAVRGDRLARVLHLDQVSLPPIAPIVGLD